jgi:two-component system cell cycle response regulator
MQVATILRQTTRGEDIVARFGGEEFVVVLPHCSLEDALTKAENLRSTVELARPSGLLVTVSIGITGMEASADNTFDGLFQRADAALYRAKGEGRNRVVKA